MRKPNVRPWSQGDDNGLCGLYATVNAIRWLWPELRKKDKHGDELISPLPNWLIRYKLRSEQFKQLYLDGDELPLISKLVQWSVEWLRTTKGFEARFTYPFKLAPPSDKSTYWQRLLPLIEPRNVVGVIGFNDPYRTGPSRRTKPARTPSGCSIRTCSKQSACGAPSSARQTAKPGKLIRPRSSLSTGSLERGHQP